MPIPLILIVAILCLLLMHNIKRSNQMAAERSARFWKREAEADTVRKQDVSSLNYIYIPVETLPFGVDTSPEVQNAEAIIRRLDSTKILNLNQYTNTDLKMAYGPANLNFLTQCDERFTLLARTLYQWACLLSEHDHIPEAIQVATYCLEIGSEISGCYYMLADYYRAHNDRDSIQKLLENAETLNGLQADSIRDYLNKSME